MNNNADRNYTGFMVVWSDGDYTISYSMEDVLITVKETIDEYAYEKFCDIDDIEDVDLNNNINLDLSEIPGRVAFIVEPNKPVECVVIPFSDEEMESIYCSFNEGKRRGIKEILKHYKSTFNKSKNTVKELESKLEAEKDKIRKLENLLTFLED